jgi:hypothetical protein
MHQLRHPSESFYTRGAIYKDMLASVTEECTTTITKIDKEKVLAIFFLVTDIHMQKAILRGGGLR